MHDLDKERFFEGCLPIEVMARRGRDTLRFGPMKPVGLTDPRTGRTPYAVVQLRQDTLAGDHFSLVGFQTQLKWGEQARVLPMIPGLEQAEFVRFGMVHRNTYINGPTVLRATWQTRSRDDLLFAGQMSGVEGYVESAASGLIAGRNAAALALGASRSAPPRETAIGALGYYVSHADPRHYEPTNITFGIMPAPEPADGGQATGQGRSQGGHVRARAGGAGRVAPRRGRAHVTGHVAAFVDFLALNRNASAHTVAAYRRDVLQYLDCVARLRGRPRRAAGAVGPRPDVGPRVPGRTAQAGQARASAARKLSALRAFGRYLRREQVVESEPRRSRRRRGASSRCRRT